MATTNICDLDLFIELTDSEVSNITGGSFWGAVAGGIKRAGQGIKDGSSDGSSRHDDLWYNLGYGGGEAIRHL